MRAATVSILSVLPIFAATPASAVILQFTISGYDTNANGEREYGSFQIDSDPLPSQTDPLYGFSVNAVPGVFTYGDQTTTTPQDISFYFDFYDGGLQAGELLEFTGPQLFTGSLDHPHLVAGQYSLLDAFSGSPISLSIAAVPEPMTWAMMVLGFGTVGFTLKSRRSAFHGKRAA